MTKIFDTPKPLTDFGWQFREKCKCNYILKYKYRHPHYPLLEVEWWVKYYKFKVMNGNMVKVPPTAIGQLKDALEGIKNEYEILSQDGAGQTIVENQKPNRKSRAKKAVQEETEI